MKQWKGYTLVQLDTRRALVKLKIALEQERLKQSTGLGVATANPSRISKIVSLSTLIVETTKSINKIISIIRSFKK